MRSKLVKAMKAVLLGRMHMIEAKELATDPDDVRDLDRLDGMAKEIQAILTDMAFHPSGAKG